MTQPTAQVSRTIDAPPEKIWRALITPAKIKSFLFGADVQSDWTVGHPIRLTGEMNGKRYHDKGEIRSFEPGRRLSYTHWSDLSGAPDTPDNYHLVTFELAPKGERTEVTLTQSNLDGEERPSDREMRPEFEKTWSAVLEGLEKVVAQ